MPRPLVLAVQHVPAEPPARIATAVEAAGGEIETFAVYEDRPLPRDLERYAGLVVLGGPMGVYEADRYPHLREEARLIERALSAHRPILGVCLGSQLLASVLGARVYPGGRPEIGWYPVTVEPQAREDELFGAMPSSFTPLHWHGDIFDLPDGARPLARSALTRHQAFVFGERAYGLLFHLESTTTQVEQMSELFADELRAAEVSPEALRTGAQAHGPATEALARDLFGRWMKLVTGQASAQLS